MNFIMYLKNTILKTYVTTFLSTFKTDFKLIKYFSNILFFMYVSCKYLFNIYLH